MTGIMQGPLWGHTMCGHDTWKYDKQFCILVIMCVCVAMALHDLQYVLGPDSWDH